MKFFLTEYPIASYHKESLKLKYAPRSNSSKEMKCAFFLLLVIVMCNIGVVLLTKFFPFFF